MGDWNYETGEGCGLVRVRNTASKHRELRRRSLLVLYPNLCMKVWHAHCFHGERGARAECDCTVCTQLQCIMSNNVVVVSKSDAGVDMKGLGFKL